MDDLSTTDVRDPRQLRITLRSDLRVSVQSLRDGIYYVLEDPVQARFFQIGVSEATFVSHLDGSSTLDDAIRRTASSLGANAFSEQEALAMVRWLVDAQLASVNGHLPGASLTPTRAREAFDPLAIRIPLLHPDALLQALLPWCRWIFAPLMLLVWIVIVSLATARLWTHWDRFREAAAQTVVPGNWWSFALVWLLLKVLHETAHGVVCRKYGGRVADAGLMILWGMPVPYIDVTSSWAFRRRAARIHTAAAGLYIELLLAGIAGLAWECLPVGIASQICVHIVLVAAMASVLFNANPLMRFDGYYILMDLLAVPNLSTRGRSFWAAVLGKYVWGKSTIIPERHPGQRLLIAGYGLLASLWRAAVYVSLTVATVAFSPVPERYAPHAAALLVLTIVGLPRVARRRPTDSEYGPSRWRMGLVTASVALAGWLAFFYVPWPGRITAPGVVEYTSLEIVRAASPGLVHSVHVAPGDYVRKGQLLAVLTNPQLQAELRDLELAIEQSQLTIRTLQKREQGSGSTAELENLASLQKRRAEKQKQVEQLVLRAPGDGQVLTRRFDLVLGRYLAQGTEVATLGEDSHKEMRISIAQDDVHWFAQQGNQPVQVRVGSMVLDGHVTRVTPRASVRPVHLALSASEGGPLPVRFAAAQQGAGRANSITELVTPRFSAYVALPADEAQRLGAGQRGQVAVRVADQSLGWHMLQSLSRWCRERVREAREG